MISGDSPAINTPATALALATANTAYYKTNAYRSNFRFGGKAMHPHQVVVIPAHTRVHF